jgi:hypothetical protein
MANLPPFTYTPLATNEVRLLTPVMEDDNITWTLSIAQLNSPDLKLETLSYVWGAQDESFPVVCNGSLLWVHHNLHTALPHLARRDGIDEILPIWIDAICINQNDEKEKTAQIRLMNRIYRRASMMWIWLGIAEDQDCIPDAISLLPWLKYLNEGRENPSIHAQAKEVSPGRFRLEPSIHRAVMHLIANPWYRRLWVTQELVLSAYAIALCGDNKVSIDLLRDAQWPLDGPRTGPSLDLNADELENIWKSQLIFTAVYPGKELSEAISIEAVATFLLFMAYLTAYQRCLQPRDRVFGILGLFDWHKDEIPVVDFYSCASVLELYTEFSAFLLTNTIYVPSLSPILWGWFHNASIPGKDSSFPSWVPDLHHLVYTDHRWSVIFHSAAHRRNYQASRRLKDFRRGFQIDELKIRGRLLDSVVCVSPPMPAPPREFQSIGNTIQWWSDLADWEDEAAQLALSDTDESLYNFCHTLVGGKSSRGKEIDPCQMRRRFRTGIAKWRKLLEGLHIEKRYDIPLP